MPKPKDPCLESSVEQGVLVLTITRARVEGDQVARELQEEMLAAVAGAGTRKVVVDMHHSRYVSSTAFSPLLALRAALGKSGGQLIICDLSGAVGDVFYSTKMVSSDGSCRAPFEMAPDRATAVARLIDGAGGLQRAAASAPVPAAGDARSGTPLPRCFPAEPAWDNGDGAFGGTGVAQ